MMTFSEFGKLVNHFFESKMEWYIDTGIFYLSGRDIAVFIAGFFTCLIIWMAVYSWRAKK